VRMAAVIAAALVLAGCRQEGVTVIPPGEFPEEVEEVYRASPSPTANPEGVPSSGTVYLVDDGVLVPSKEDLPAAATLPDALLQALLEAPGARSAIPEETRVLSVVVGGGVATVDLSEEFEEGASGSDLALRVAQIVFTLTEDPDVDKVLFAIEGTQRPVIAGNQRDVLEVPVTREDYARFAPPA